MWLSEDMATHGSYAFTFEVVFGITPTTEMLDEAVQEHLDQGLQRWASFFQWHTLLTNPKTHEDNPAATKHAVEHGLLFAKVSTDASELKGTQLRALQAWLVAAPGQGAKVSDPVDPDAGKCGDPPHCTVNVPSLAS